MKVAWISTWDRICGIADYSKELWPVVKKDLEERGDKGVLFSLDKYKSDDSLIQELKTFAPDVIHFQHEYSFFGGKNPPLYNFPWLIKQVKTELPDAKLIATAHTVIPENYRYPLQGKLWQIPARLLANVLFLKKCREFWGPKTWGVLHGTIVHSQNLIDVVKKAGSPYVQLIPLFVPVREKAQESNKNKKTVLVFGFFSYDKGQDMAIESFKYLKDLPQVQLVLAGGSKPKDSGDYLNECEKKIKSLGLNNVATITGFLESNELKKYFDEADLVVTPFRWSSGSASITHALARGLPILASDLPLNLEINEREAGTLAYFSGQSPRDLSQKIRELLFDSAKLRDLRQGALRYAVSHSPNRIALQHLMVYDNLVK